MPAPSRRFLPLILAACAAWSLAPGARSQSTGLEYVTFWRGDLRVIATRPDTRVTILDIDTGLPLDPATWLGNFTTNPFRLDEAGDAFEASSSSFTRRVRIVAERAAGPAEEKPVVTWTGMLSAGLKHPPSPPPDGNSWASYVPDVLQGVGSSIGGELGREFIGFTSRDMYVIAQKTGDPVSITVEDLVTNTDADSDDSFVLDASSPSLVHEDGEVEIYRYSEFEDDTFRLTSNVPTTVLVGLVSTGFPDWAATPPSYGAGDGGRELGSLFWTFASRWLTILPVEDDTTVTITDLSDGDDDDTFVLANGNRFNPSYDVYVSDPVGRTPTTSVVPRASDPAVRLLVSADGPVDDDFLKITSDRPILVQVGPIASDTNEFADVAYSVPTGPTSQLIHAFAQNGGANDFQLFSTAPDNAISITSLSYTMGFGTLNHDFEIPTPTPFEGGNVTTGDWYWSSGAWHAELLRIESDQPVQVMSGDYDQPNFGAFIPFVAVVTTRPPRADAGSDLSACPGEEIVLDGSASFDGDVVDGGGTETWEWDLDVAVDSDGNGVSDDDVDATGAVVMASFPDGMTTIQLTFTDDDGETDTDFLTVTVEDVEPPVLDCPELVRAVATDFTGGDASPMATASDDCDPSPLVVNSRTDGGADASDFYPCGATSVTYTATDASGNSSTCTTTVLVAPEGAVARVGPALRVRKSAAGEPLLDWSRVGDPGPESLFVVLRGESPEAVSASAPSGGPFADLTWTDATAGGATLYYDVRVSLCDGRLSDD